MKIAYPVLLAFALAACDEGSGRKMLPRAQMQQLEAACQKDAKNAHGAMQCRSARIMPYFLAAYPDREAQIRDYFDDMETMGSMVDRKKMTFRQLNEYGQSQEYKIITGGKPHCSEAKENENCVIGGPGGALFERSQRIERR